MKPSQVLVDERFNELMRMMLLKFEKTANHLIWDLLQPVRGGYDQLGKILRTISRGHLKSYVYFIKQV